ncbi:hypothetical protein EOA32_03170 [Mesorhizobium sp. M1A.F.Ca.ET.072.01.1.1]|uniref:hypothetical protein n=1 Tax=Mesorhizobium sp. M1A.F.Ca.ET.072.01.1.1 TaxID=2496753 RepID=UPI000FD27A76|nr:hypothetical protein [Mesorhizobium sp. M1A.F.Ca.ET.072.01.1.1]RUW55038.1 hypothetical protein EOA32_03170 [Mesorhizobium sp. M1A.F.Ca.ET.072.01.1.1]TIV04726.1 MAG: hypothetical protein E5W04_02245 [Mesorhizobium sp.]
MQLKQEILAALAACGATEAEIASITSYYADQLTAAQAAVDQINDNIASFQTQLMEATAHRDAIGEAIGKFVVSEQGGGP